MTSNNNNTDNIQNNGQPKQQYNTNSVVSNWAALKAMATSRTTWIQITLDHTT